MPSAWPREPDQPTDPLEYYNWLVDHIGMGDQNLPKLPAGTDPIKHVRNFLDCVKSRREPYFPAEVGHRCSSVAHIGTIAMTVGRPLRWDPEAERFPDAPDAIGPYSQATRCGHFVFTAMQIALDPDTNQLVGDDHADQAHRCLRNVQTILEAAGSSLAYTLEVMLKCVQVDARTRWSCHSKSPPA